MFRRVLFRSAGDTDEVSFNSGGLSEAAGETGAAASNVLNAAGELSRQSTELKSEVDRFLAAVKAA